MILDNTKKTAFVLGAGASKPYGFPLGTELNAEMLAHLQTGKGQLKNEYKFADKTLRELICVLEDNQYSSFDQLLEHKPKFREIGSILIASSLLPKESSSKISKTRDWYDTFFSYCEFGETEDAINSVVTFNYDRSLQYALERKIISLPDKKEEIAEKLRTNMQFCYPHGTLEAANAYPFGEFGQHPNMYDYIFNCAKKLKIISDDLTNENDYVAARACVNASEQIVILGFGYARPTLDNLFHGIDISKKSLFLCFYGMHHDDAASVAEYFTNRGCKNIEEGDSKETANIFFKRILTGETYIRK